MEFNEKFSNDFICDECLSASTLDSNLIGPTLPPIPAFTLPTGPTGDTGPTGSTGAIPTNNFGFYSTDTSITYPASSILQMNQNNLQNGNVTLTDPTTITLSQIGYYWVEWSAEVTSVAQGNHQISLFVNSTLVDGSSNAIGVINNISNSGIPISGGALLNIITTNSTLQTTLSAPANNTVVTHFSIRIVQIS
ncbi:exosporium leader peptide-containing protein [Bacillus sp. 196mf]|uniref:exosporium leader peptide-containing protein n=1 Tax=Bacillus sp. 196mf TaxID=1761754 RepID=UPI0023EE5EA3|nr:exosporium leader peptide-containing protein [Bacillus sp. 196mf]